MYTIGICDDDRLFVDEMEEKIKEIARESEMELFVLKYYSGEELLESGIVFHLLILDMQMETLDGYQTAFIFREKNPETVLVFCSGSVLPSTESFKFRPFRYLLKSMPEEQLFDEMRDILAEVRRVKEKVYLMVHRGKQHFKIRLGDIFYVENVKRGSRIFLDSRMVDLESEDILIDKKIKELCHEYSSLQMVHASFLVNIFRVASISNYMVTMEDGSEIKVSRAYYRELREAFAKSLESPVRE